MENDILWKSANEIKKLSQYEYLFKLAKKSKAFKISLTAAKHDFTHIVGLDHLKDIERLTTTKEKIKEFIFEDILSKRMTLKDISSSAYFNQPFPCTYNYNTEKEFTLTERLEASLDIAYYLDNAYNKGKFYKWDPSKVRAKMPDNKTTRRPYIKADYMLTVPSKANQRNIMYIFMYEKGYVDEQVSHLYIHSAFMDGVDLSNGLENPFAILFEEKTNVKAKITERLYTLPSYAASEKAELSEPPMQYRLSRQAPSSNTESKSVPRRFSTNFF